MPQNFCVRFGDANHGWLPVKLITNKEEFLFTASYVPYDSLSELVEALSLFLRTGASKLVRWNTEPIEYEFVLSEYAEQARLEVFEYPGSQRIQGTGKAVFEFSGSRKSLIVPFWPALRDLETRVGFEQQWQRSLPKHKMQLLGQQIDKL
ncbi:hypothetical protein I8752_06965 [Nostocaceae cyanobacterium CENA369]|uniref:Uncharacterized protein n=1 Tax=Dendronalium phyllosphericum CENA369 TaxID=1725256 RepID=A0A8J7LE83_9NOST|nr:hypothetical protein [Dendronalium phyllosphericum]MBH8572758.1 hypothetical protein [Dendronalium phyllosphericum CENA369]